MFRRTRFIRALGLVTAIGSAAALAFLADGSAMASVSTSQPSAKAAHEPRISGLRLKEIHVPATRLAPNMRARYFSGRSAAATVAAYAFVDYADGQCLNANNQGPSAGQNGDAVQLWNCGGALNNYWIPVDYSGTSYWLESAQYPGMCLNAVYSNGIGIGHHVQLWNCYYAFNEYWDFGDWYNSVYGQGYVAPLYLAYLSNAWCLDANMYGLGNGDFVQIWNYWGGANQLWY